MDISIALDLLEKKKMELALPQGESPDQYIKNLEDLISEQKHSDRKDAIKTTVSGIQGLQTVAVGSIALIGLILQYFVSIGVDLLESEMVYLYLSAVAAFASIYIGMKAIGAAIKSLRDASNDPWRDGHMELNKKLQAAFGMLAVVFFIVSVISFSNGKIQANPSLTGGASVSVTSWESLRVEFRSAVIEIGPATASDQARLNVQVK